MKLKPVIICAFLVASAILVAIPMRTKAAGPTFSDIKWDPKYPWPGVNPPTTGDKINVSATIEDPAGINVITLLYCSIPGGLCTTWGMERDGGSKYYNNTLTVFSDATGADIQIVATNGNMEQNLTALYYIAYALSINATMTADRGSVYPGGHFNLTVSAHYWNNTSAMAEYSQVDIVREGSAEHWLGITDANGACTIEVTAPMAVMVYTYNASVTNRTLTGYANEQTMAVQTEPLPDLKVSADDIVYAPPNPTEGDNISADIGVHNIGTDDDTFQYVVTLDAGGSKVELRNTTATVQAGDTAVIHVWWIAVAGNQWLNVTLDPDNDSRELNEQNNHASVLITAQRKPISEQSPILVYAAIAGVAIVVIILAAVPALRKRRPGQSKEPPQPPIRENQPPQ